MNKEAHGNRRILKTAWFARAARKAGISDGELCEAMAEVMKGQGVDLGGGVFKKRLNRNMHRGIVVAKGARCWVYTYLFTSAPTQWWGFGSWPRCTRRRPKRTFSRN